MTGARPTLKQVLKRRFAGVSWQSPQVQRALPVVDAADRAVRTRRGLADVPPYSVRVRGTGMSEEFGGTKFFTTGARLADSLVRHAGLEAGTRVLEIGCGAGRIAYALTRLLDHGHYTGLDIDAVSIESCRRTPALTEAGFRFVHLDLASDLYNRGGQEAAASTRLPFDDATFDLVYLESVFTHLTGEECAHYAREMMRVLAPGGRAVVSGYLREEGTGTSPFTFEHRVGDVWVQYPDNPLKAVAMQADVADGWFGRPHTRRLLGSWRGGRGEYPNVQDWLIYTR